MHQVSWSVCLLMLLATAIQAEDEAPFIDAKAIKERFATITQQEMDSLRQRHVLIASKSMGLNLVTGLNLLAKQSPMHDISTGFQRFDVEKKGGLAIIPADIYQKSKLVHFLATRYPVIKRVEETDQLMRRPPWTFSAHVDVVMIVFVAEVTPAFFPSYCAMMNALARDMPRTRFIHCTSSVLADGPEKSDRSVPNMLAFSELVRATYRGKAPVYDLAAILSDDFRNGTVMLPEYSKDATGVHPNQPAGEIQMAKGFILAMRDALRWKGGAASSVGAPIVATKVETLPPEHPEYRAVRAILDRNGLTAMRVEGQTTVRDGHVVGLFIQEAGVQEIPTEIGELAYLERLHCYSDRTLGHPLLRSISPAIAKCVRLQELSLANNDLSALPAEMVNLKNITSLSLAGNRLHNLPAPVTAWITSHDPTALSRQAADK